MKKIAWGKVTHRLHKRCILDIDGLEVEVDGKDTLGEMNVGEEYLVIFWAENVDSDRYLGSEVISEHLQAFVSPGHFSSNQKFRGTVYWHSEVGTNIFFGGKYTGLLYQNESFKKLEEGQEVDVYVKDIREDGKVNLSLYPTHFQDAANTIQQLILDKLSQNNGELLLSDKSSSEEISTQLGISKSKFKQNIGMLYKEQKIVILEDRIKLNLDSLGQAQI